MTIRRRFYLSLIAVLVLFLANLFIYFWSARIRTFAKSEWEQASACELMISSIRQELRNAGQEVMLVSQIQQEDNSLVIPDEITVFESRTIDAEKKIENLKAVASADQLAPIEEFRKSYLELSQAWLSYYHNAGKDENAAVRSLAHAEVLEQVVFDEQLDHLQELEDGRSFRAKLQFQNAETLANRVMAGTFLLSILIALTLSSRLSHHLVKGFSTLKQGAHLIGDMELEHRISYPARDEFSELAQSFNEMAEKLSSARHRLLQTNMQLSESETRYRNLVNRAVYGIYRCTESGRFLDANPALINMLGYSSRQELLNVDLVSEVYANAADFYDLLAKLKEFGYVEGFEVNWKTCDGQIIITRLSGNVVAAQGGISECEMIAENVTTHRALEDQFRQAQKMEAVGRLAGGIAHDFNNLLTIIKGHSELLHSELRAGDQAKKEVEGVIRAADRAAALTRQLLAFSRRQLLSPKVLEINSIVTNMEKLLARLLGEDVQLTTTLGQDIGLIKADPNQIEQVIMNLAVNARDAMPTGGQLRIVTSTLDIKEELRQGKARLKPGSYVMLSVIDTGQGMDQATCAQAFEPFFTTKEPGKGTGLGLSTVYGIVKQSEGEIWVESEPGTGCAFHICFPQVVEVQQQAAAEPKPVIQAGGKETILIVEDEEDVRDVAGLMLKRRGYNVLPAANARDAEKICRTHPEKIHLLLTDVVLKEAGGPELAQLLNVIRPEMGIIYMSGYTDDVVLQHGIRNSQVAFLPKPFTTEELAGKVREVLDKVAEISSAESV